MGFIDVLLGRDRRDDPSDKPDENREDEIKNVRREIGEIKDRLRFLETEASLYRRRRRGWYG